MTLRVACLLPTLLVGNAALAQNPLPTPIPGQNLHLGYYFSDGRHGDLASEVSCYTNLYVSWARRGYECSADSPNSGCTTSRWPTSELDAGGDRAGGKCSWTS